MKHKSTQIVFFSLPHHYYNAFMRLDDKKCKILAAVVLVDWSKKKPLKNPQQLYLNFLHSILTSLFCSKNNLKIHSLWQFFQFSQKGGFFLYFRALWVVVIGIGSCS